MSVRTVEIIIGLVLLTVLLAAYGWAASQLYALYMRHSLTVHRLLRLFVVVVVVIGILALYLFSPTLKGR